MSKKKTLGTGSERGTYKWGDKHPWAEGRFFSNYVSQNGRVNEQWMTKDKLEARRERARIAKEKSRGGKKINRQTGSERGFFKMGDVHPVYPDYRFVFYSKNGDGFSEYWTTESKYNQNVAKRSDRNAKRRDKVGHWSGKPAFPLLYQFRDILNSKHPYASSNGMFHVDHIERLADGGKHEESNLQLSTATWNLLKG